MRGSVTKTSGSSPRKFKPTSVGSGKKLKGQGFHAGGRSTSKAGGFGASQKCGSIKGSC